MVVLLPSWGKNKCRALRSAQWKASFHYDKCKIKKPTITFFGNRYSTAGIQPDPEKIKDIQNMPTPRNKEELQTFLGLMNYLSQFIPKFADKTHLVRSLLKEDAPWTWEPKHEQSFEDLNREIINAKSLKY